MKKFLLVLLLLIPRLGHASDDALPVLLEVTNSSPGDSGDKFVHALKEKIRQSKGFKLTSTPGLHLHLWVSITPAQITPHLMATSVIWTLEPADKTQLEGYLTHSVGTAGEAMAESFAEGTLARTEHLAEDCRAIIAQQQKHPEP